MRNYDPRPVYIVPQPARRNWLGVLVIAAVAVLVVVGGAQHRQDRAPAATAAGSAFAAPTADQRVRSAIGDALARQAQLVNMKAGECNAVTNDDAAYARCDREYQALDAQWKALDQCTRDVTALAAVATCERQVGIH